ncbi:MAG: phytanoyl-CoA dioxygenase family protein [Pseudomonadota bacterium]
MMNLRSSLETDGYAIARNFLDKDELNSLLQCCESVSDQYGVRNLLKRLPRIQDILFAPKLHTLLDALECADALPVRSLFFNKNHANNWLVPWHQDLSIAVNQKTDAGGYAKWTHKDDTHYVEPPVEILESILTLRFALDSADEDNGALKILPGSHLLGKLNSEGIQDLKEKRMPVSCSVQAGDLLLMRPLLVHSSAKAVNPSNRRVVHLELSSASLASPMIWAEC